MYRITEKEKKLRFIAFFAPLKLIFIWFIVNSLAQPTAPAGLLHVDNDEKRKPQVIVSLLYSIFYISSFVVILVRNSKRCL